MKQLIILFLFSIFSNTVNSTTSVWKVTKNNTTIYLGGTIHLLRQVDYPLPKAFDQAYNASQIITFETDITALNSPQMMQTVLRQLSYSNEKTIESETKPTTYQKLKKYANKLGISLEFFRKAKPGLLMSTFLVHELQTMGINQEGIDMHFLKKANKENKLTLFLETPQEQLAFLAKMGVGNEDSFYLNMLRDFKNTKTQLITMIDLWRNGNSSQLNQVVNEPMKKDYPKMYQFLLVERNNNWLPVIEKYFKTKATEFVLVGAAHLVGEQGIIQQLQKKGYQVSKL